MDPTGAGAKRKTTIQMTIEQPAAPAAPKPAAPLAAQNKKVWMALALLIAGTAEAVPPPCQQDLILTRVPTSFLQARESPETVASDDDHTDAEAFLLCKQKPDNDGNRLLLLLK